MNERTIQRAGRFGVLVFMGVATALMLAFTFHEAARGVVGIPGMVVYAFCAGFGLEFVCSAWRGGHTRARRRIPG